VLWGIYQGAMLVVARAVQAWSKRRGLQLPAGIGASRVALGVLMFLVTCYGWLIFRAASVGQVGRFTRLLFTNLTPSPTSVSVLLVPMCFVIGPLLAVHVYQARRGSETAPLALSPALRYALYGAVMYLVLVFGDFGGSQFIYFQF
jgi:D-alanyl-lipoteichoic acid acyltransferase DltB (MBOAT superfamily)